MRAAQTRSKRILAWSVIAAPRAECGVRSAGTNPHFALRTPHSGLFFLSQHSAKDLPYRSFRERLTNLDLHGPLEFSEVLRAVIAQIVLGALGARLQHDEGLHHLAAIGVGD